MKYISLTVMKIVSNKFLLLLLLGDFAFMLVDFFYRLRWVSNPLFSTMMDFGYPEVYQYIKEYWIVALLLMLAIKRSYLVYYAWSLLFIYLLLDDSLQIHEIFGAYLSNYFEFQPMFGLRAQDFGELSVTALFASLLFTFIGISYLSSDNIAKQISKNLFILILLIAFFGIVLDMFHVIANYWWLETILGMMEDGGEMLIMSIIVGYLFVETNKGQHN